MKKLLFSILFVLTMIFVIGCEKNTEENKTTNNNKTDISTTNNSLDPNNIEVLSEYQRYDIGEKNDAPLIGFGAQMDTDIFMPWNNMTKEDEEIWENRIKEMNLKYTRIKYFPEFLERANDNDDPNVFDYDSKDVDFECAEMQALYKVLDLCEKYSIKVDFSLSGCYHWFESYDGKYKGTWLGEDSSSVSNYWVTGPTDFDEYAENIVIVTKYLLEVKKYTCIWGISNISESFFNENGVKSWDSYVESCRIIRDRLIKEGIKDKILFIGCSENGGVPKYYKEEFETVKDIFDVCCTGNYNWDYTCENESIRNYFTDMLDVVKYYGKTDFAISEFCQGKHFTDAVHKTDIDDYSAGLYIARFCIEAAKAGVTAFDHYILGDTFFTNSYIHTMGLWMYRDSNVVNPEYISWAAHPEYYFYAMVSRYTDRGAYAYKVNEELKSEYDDEDRDIAIVAVELLDGSWSYYIANTSNESKKIAVVNTLSTHPQQMNAYKVTESWIPEDRACVLPESFKVIDASNGVAYVTVPANGLLVVSNKIVE